MTAKVTLTAIVLALAIAASAADSSAGGFVGGVVDGLLMQTSAAVAKHVSADRRTLTLSLTHPLLVGRDICFVSPSRLSNRGTYFEQHGVPQPFGEPDAYERGRLAERLPRGLLVKYLAALGIHVDEPDFFGAGVLLQGSGLVPQRVLTLAEARAEYSQRSG